MYVITGASGNTGKRIAAALLAENKAVRVIGRNLNRLQELVDQGGQAYIGDLDNGEFLKEAFTGAKAVYAMIPPDYGTNHLRQYQNKVGESLYEAIKSRGVQYVVNLSSLGGDLPEKTGPILGLYDQEKRLNQLQNVNIVHLRPTYFMENLLPNLQLIKTQGIMGSPLEPDLSFPVIATQDIAEVATQHLLNLDFSGHSVHNLLGKEDMSMKEMTAIIGQKIGKRDLPYVQFSYEETAKAMLQMGLSQDMVDAMIELNRSMNEGKVIAQMERTPETTTRTSFEDFATFFAQVYAQA